MTHSPILCELKWQWILATTTTCVMFLYPQCFWWQTAWASFFFCKIDYKQACPMMSSALRWDDVDRSHSSRNRLINALLCSYMYAPHDLPASTIYIYISFSRLAIQGTPLAALRIQYRSPPQPRPLSFRLSRPSTSESSPALLSPSWTLLSPRPLWHVASLQMNF